MSLTTNTTSLQEILAAVNALPEAGGVESGGSSEVTLGKFSCSSETISPVGSDYTLTSNELQSSTRNVIIVFAYGSNFREDEWIKPPVCFLYREDKNDTFSVITQSSSIVSTPYMVEVSENEIVLFEIDVNTQDTIYFRYFTFLAV